MRIFILLIAAAFGLAQDWTSIPDGGEPMLPEDSLSVMRVTGTGGLASSEIVSVDGMPFQRALRIDIRAGARQLWDVQILGTTQGDVQRGDVLLLSLFVRGRSPANESGEGFGTAYLQRNSGAFEKLVSLPFHAGGEWRQFLIPVRADITLPFGQHGFAAHLGYLQQTLEIGGISLTNYRTSRALEDLPRTKITYQGEEADAPWRKQALESIDRLRKADVRVVVKDSTGVPIPNAEVHIRQTRHEFGFGSAVAADGLTASGENGDRYREVVRTWFNKVVLENDLKWPNWESNRSKALGALQWLRENGNPEVRGHTLVWPSWRYLPRDVESLAASPDALRTRILQHIADELQATRGQLVEWDVLNEPFTNTDVQRVLGDGEMAEWFKEARKHEPDAVLYINDYSILSNGGFDRAHQDGYYNIIQRLIEGGAPLDGIGMQGHFGSQLTPPVRIWGILDRFAQLGKAIQITEFDIDVEDENVQAAYTKDFITAVFAHPAVKGFLMWGFWEGRHWKPRAAMFRRDWTLKPNGEAFYNTVFGDFWTDVRGTTDSAGAFATRAFLGRYSIEAKVGEQTVKSEIVVTLNGAEAVLTVP